MAYLLWIPSWIFGIAVVLGLIWFLLTHPWWLVGFIVWCVVAAVLRELLPAKHATR